MSTYNIAAVPKLSGTAEFPDKLPDLGAGRHEIIDSTELARRWNLPESWIRTHVGNRIAKAERIPCLRLGRYVRFRWGSPELEAWLAKQQG